ncbi:thymidylate synthase/dCMP hydroxymethylase domain-containing protein, partial [Tribonema minus]
GAAALRDFVVVVAATAGSLGIGKGGGIPWKLAGDMAYFKKVTSACDIAGKVNAVVMGRKTWESIPQRFRPLPGRCNVVLTRNPRARQELVLPDDVIIARSLEDALSCLSTQDMRDKVHKIFVIGGGQVYKEALGMEQCKQVHLTTVEAPADGKQFECDTFFPPLDPASFKLVSRGDKQSENGIDYRFNVYERQDSSAAPASGSFSSVGATNGSRSSSAKDTSGAAIAEEPNDEERQYLDLVQDIIDNGALRGDRTGTGTLSKFGAQMRFSLRGGRFPLLTTKRVFWRGVAEELLWFVAGCTDAGALQAKNIHIWDGNGSRAFLDSRGLEHREEGDLGPVYGFQWRHFGAKYVDFRTDYKGQGVDQLADCIHKIKNSPDDRRIIMSAWNPCDLELMALPPCHMFCQFYVANGELSCQMYQRSADMGLGVPFNIASYSLLTCMVAQVCGLKPGDFIHTIGDAHVYVNHVDALREQIKRVPRPFPKLRLHPARTDIDSFEMKDFTLEGYNPMNAIKMQMAV